MGDEQKLDIVMSVGVSGARVTEVAHRHDVTRQQIYTCRSELNPPFFLAFRASTKRRLEWAMHPRCVAPSSVRQAE
ncbi:transposase [Mesorhizobium sp. M0816]